MKITEITDNYINDIGALASTEVQKEAFENFKSRGLPHTKMEDWLYTKLTDVLPTNFKKVSEPTTLKNVQTPGKYQIVFLNGNYSKVDSFIPDEINVTISSIDNAHNANYKDDKTDIFSMINTATTNEIVEINVAKNFCADDTVSIVHLCDFQDAFSTTRVHVRMEQFSKCSFVEIFTGTDEKKYNQIAVTNFSLAPGAHAKHIKVQAEGNQAFHAGTVNATLEKDSNFMSFTFNTGAQKARHNLQVWLTEPGAYCSVDGLYALKGTQHCDNFSNINHLVEHTNSSQMFKGVLDDSSRGVFTGRVLVCKDAQLVNSEQINKNLLLTKKAHVDTRPQLEVYADDVKCAHGATVGQMSEEEAFYLQSRGLSKQRAQKLLIHAFCAEAIAKIEDEKIESYLSQVLFESFEKVAFEHIDSNNASK